MYQRYKSKLWLSGCDVIIEEVNCSLWPAKKENKKVRES